MFKKPKITKIICDAPIRRVIKKKEELPEEVKQLQDEIKKIEEDENLNTVIETPIAQDVQALINTKLKETGKIYEDENGKRFKYILATGIRTSGGHKIPYTYKKIYYLKEQKKRGPKKADNKIMLRKLLTKLKDQECAKILNYISNNIRKVNNGCETDNKEQNPIQAVL
jgi:hypothetical protein